MNTLRLLALLFLSSTLSANESFERIPVSYTDNGTDFQGMLVYEKGISSTNALPGILMIPNWMGPTENAYEKAEFVASNGFVVFVADMYGVDVRPANSGEAGKAAGTIRGNREMMRKRALKAVQVFDDLATEHPIDTEKTVAIGFCFGGGTVLELARTGIESIEGVVSFHGDYKSPTLDSDAKNVKIPQLVLHGADDPYVPQSDVAAYISAMQTAKVEDWTLVQFSNTVHSFTNPAAQSDGARYHPRSAKRAFEMMEDFAQEVLKLDD